MSGDVDMAGSSVGQPGGGDMALRGRDEDPPEAVAEADLLGIRTSAPYLAGERKAIAALQAFHTQWILAEEEPPALTSKVEAELKQAAKGKTVRWSGRALAGEIGTRAYGYLIREVRGEIPPTLEL